MMTRTMIDMKQEDARASSFGPPPGMRGRGGFRGGPPPNGFGGPRGRGGPRGPPPRWGPPGGGNFGPPGNGPPSLMDMGGGPPQGWQHGPPGNHDFSHDPPTMKFDDEPPMNSRDNSQEKEDQNKKNKSVTPGMQLVIKTFKRDLLAAILTADIA